jgi:hypothetical protein
VRRLCLARSGRDGAKLRLGASPGCSHCGSLYSSNSRPKYSSECHCCLGFSTLFSFNGLCIAFLQKLVMLNSMRYGRSLSSLKSLFSTPRTRYFISDFADRLNRRPIFKSNGQFPLVPVYSATMSFDCHYVYIVRMSSTVVSESMLTRVYPSVRFTPSTSVSNVFAPSNYSIGSGVCGTEHFHDNISHSSKEHCHIPSGTDRTYQIIE